MLVEAALSPRDESHVRYVEPDDPNRLYLELHLLAYHSTLVKPWVERQSGRVAQKFGFIMFRATCSSPTESY